MNRKKELKEQYKHMKKDMGIFIIRNSFNNKCYIEGTQDLKGTINGTKFKLKCDSHFNKELQKEWKAYGEENFTIEILENLKYDKDELKTDYKEDLEVMRIIWEEKLVKEKLEFYKKSLKNI